MRISLADSLMSGFKKWSDTQRAKEQPVTADAAPQRVPASSHGDQIECVR
jgi:hypothetical protein